MRQERGRRHLQRAVGMVAALAGALTLVAPSARADPPAPARLAAGLAALRRTPTYREAIVAGAKRSGAWVAHPCGSADLTLGDRLGLVAAPSFDDEGRASSGAWIEHLTADGCGERRQLNVLVLARGPGQLATVPLLPGTTRADPLLQRDGAAYAFLGAGIDRAGCKPIYIADTAFLDYAKEPPAVPGKPSWSERWTVAQCDKRVPVVLRFVPDARGTAIIVDHAAGP